MTVHDNRLHVTPNQQQAARKSRRGPYVYVDTVQVDSFCRTAAYGKGVGLVKRSDTEVQSGQRTAQELSFVPPLNLLYWLATGRNGCDLPFPQQGRFISSNSFSTGLIGFFVRAYSLSLVAGQVADGIRI
jgi:hypothetical protein